MHQNNLIQHTLNNSQSNLNHHHSHHQNHSNSHSHQPIITQSPNSSIKRIKTDEDDLELLAKKKKNADAQAAFRLRRQTYIKSLEDTVTELQNAVKEMEVLVKTANLEVKIKCEQVSYLENKIKQNQNGISSSNNPSSSHCTCCRFSTTYTSSTTTTPKFLNQQNSSSNNPTSNNNNTSNTNSANNNPSSSIANHSILNSAPHTPNTLEAQSNEWSTASTSHRPYPSIITSSSHHQPSSSPSHLLQDSRHSSKLEPNRLYDQGSSNDHESNQGNHSTNTYNPRCDISFFDPFNINQSTPPFYSSLEPVLNPNHQPTNSLDMNPSYSRSNPSTPNQLLSSQYPSSSTGSLSHPSKPYPLNYSSVLDDPHSHSHHSHAFGYDEDHPHPQAGIKKRREEESNLAHAHKLNGLPAKVARCEQTVMEVSKVVLQAKEQAQLVASEQQKRIMKLNSSQAF